MSEKADKFRRFAEEARKQAEKSVDQSAERERWTRNRLVIDAGPKLVLEALKDGKVRMTCSAWEDARVLASAEMLGLRREGTYWVVSRIVGIRTSRCA